MEMGFKDLGAILKDHDRKIKKIKKDQKGITKRLSRIEKKVQSHHLMLVRKLDQSHKA